METIAKLIVAACAALLPGTLAAETFTCADAYGKITYSGKQCKELGLKDAGEVKDRLNTSPAIQPTVKEGRPRTPPAPAPAPAAAQTTETQPSAEEPANPDRRCFV